MDASTKDDRERLEAGLPISLLSATKETGDTPPGKLALDGPAAASSGMSRRARSMPFSSRDCRRDSCLCGSCGRPFGWSLRPACGSGIRFRTFGPRRGGGFGPDHGPVARTAPDNTHLAGGSEVHTAGDRSSASPAATAIADAISCPGNCGALSTGDAR